MKKTCSMHTMISAFADGQLSERDRGRVERHLSTCERCREEYAAVCAVNRLLGDVDEIEPSSGFASGFWQKLAQTERPKPKTIWPGWRQWGFRPVWAAAAATVVIAFGLLFYRQISQTPFNASGSNTALLIAEDMELYENFEIIQHMDMLEQWETLSSMKDI